MIDVRNPGDGFGRCAPGSAPSGRSAASDRGARRRPADRGRVGAADRRHRRAPAGQHRGPVERGHPGRGRPRVRRDLRRRRRGRPVRLGVPAGPGRPPAHHRRLAVPRRVLPAPGLRPASPVLRVRPRARPGPAHAGPAVVPAVRREAGQHPGDRRAVQGGPGVPARDHELAVQGTARHGVHPERAGHDHRRAHGRGRGPAVPGQEPGAVHRGADDLPGGAGHRHQGRLRLRHA